jgi:hypothetical protein
MDMLEALVTGGYYAKAEILDMMSADSEANSLFDWKNPAGTHNPSKVNSPTFAAYTGFTGITAGGHCIRTNFMPLTDVVLGTKDSLCIIAGIGTAYGAGVDSGYVFGVSGGGGNIIKSRFHATDNNNYVNLNNTTQDPVWTGVDGNPKHLGMSRKSSTVFDVWHNTSKQTVTRTSTALPEKEMYACGYNNSDTITAYPCNLRYLFIFSGLLEAEVQGVMAIMETYLDKYGTGLV